MVPACWRIMHRGSDGSEDNRNTEGSGLDDPDIIKRMRELSLFRRM